MAIKTRIKPNALPGAAGTFSAKTPASAADIEVVSIIREILQTMSASLGVGVNRALLGLDLSVNREQNSSLEVLRENAESQSVQTVLTGSGELI